MRYFRLFGVITTIVSFVEINAKEVTDTLFSAAKDRVIVTYDISYGSGKVMVRFTDVKKKLGEKFRSKYKKLNEIEVFFFDRTGLYENMRFSGESIDAFMVPASMSYKRSADGFFMLSDSPIVTMDLKTAETAVLAIPLYLANYEGKRHYHVFTRCNDLKVKLNNVRGSANIIQEKKIQETVTSTEELETELSIEDEAKLIINNVAVRLAEIEKLPFPEDLTFGISKLRELEYKITDNSLRTRIGEVLMAYESKKQILEEQSDKETREVQEAAEREAKMAAERTQARQDSIAAAAQQQAEKDKQRNLWMIIGGALLAVSCFAGNQVIQHFRNRNNQRNIMEMQQAVAKKAEDEAKRRAQGMIRNKTNQVANEARRVGRDKLNTGIKNIGKSNKNRNISI